MKHKLLLTIFVITFFFGFLFPVMALIPNDTYYSKQWYLPIIKADKAWEITTGSPEIIVAVIDGGVDIDHPDLINNIWTNPNEIEKNGIDDDKNGYIDDMHGWDFIENSNNSNPKFLPNFTKAAINHGTIISGIIAAEGNNNQGIIGISPKTKIMPLRVLNEQGIGNSKNVIKAVDYAIKNGAQILNLSFVGDEKNEEFSKTIKRAWKAGLIIVAAAGNEKLENKNHGNDLDKIAKYPICYDTQENIIIGVAAVDNKDQKINLSNFGSKVDISAPGIDFYGTQVYNSNEANFKEYYGGYHSGTSIATPQIVAAATLIWSQFPNLTNKEVQNFILKGTDNINEQNLDYKNKLGKGRLNIYQALKLAQDSSLSVGESKTKKIIITSYKDNRTYLKIFDINANLNYKQTVYNQHFTGGVNIATGDVDGDGKDEIVTGPKVGEPLVKIFDQDGNLKNQFLAYDLNFNKGISVAIGDVDGDGKNEIVTGPKIGEPLVKIFDQDGNLKYQTMAYNPNFKGGINVTTGDVDGDGKDELIVGVASQKSSYVRLYKIVENSLFLEFQTMIFNPNFKGGINVTTGDVDGDGKDELIVGVASQKSSYVRLYKIVENSLFLEFQTMIFNPNFKGGINVTTGDVDGDGKDEIITGQGEAGQSIVKIFDGNANLKSEFKSFDSEFQGGINVSVI